MQLRWKYRYQYWNINNTVQCPSSILHKYKNNIYCYILFASISGVISNLNYHERNHMFYFSPFGTQDIKFNVNSPKQSLVKLPKYCYTNMFYIIAYVFFYVFKYTALNATSATQKTTQDFVVAKETLQRKMHNTLKTVMETVMWVHSQVEMWKVSLFFSCITSCCLYES